MKFRKLGAALIATASIFGSYMALAKDYKPSEKPVIAKAEAEYTRHRKLEESEGVNLGDKGWVRLKVRGDKGSVKGSEKQYIIDIDSFDPFSESTCFIGGDDDSFDFSLTETNVFRLLEDEEVGCADEIVPAGSASPKMPEWVKNSENEIVGIHLKANFVQAEGCRIQLPVTIKKPGSKLHVYAKQKPKNSDEMCTLETEIGITDRSELGVNIDSASLYGPRPLTNYKGKAIVKRLSWSPDNRQIAFATMKTFSAERGAVNFYKLNITDLDGNRRRLEEDIFFRDSFSGDVAVIEPDFVWSPDGKIYVADRDGIWAINPETEDRERLEDADGIEFGLSVSKTGRLAFMSKNKGGIGLCVSDNGSIKKIKPYGPETVIGDPLLYSTFSIKWFPDGKRVAVNYWKGDNIALDIVDMETGAARTIETHEKIHGFVLMAGGAYAFAPQGIASNSSVLKIDMVTGKIEEALGMECYSISSNPSYPLASAFILSQYVKEGNGLYLADVNGDVRMIKHQEGENPKGQAIYQQWSPDGKNLGIILRGKSTKGTETMDLYWMGFDWQGKKYR